MEVREASCTTPTTTITFPDEKAGGGGGGGEATLGVCWGDRQQQQQVTPPLSDKAVRRGRAVCLAGLKTSPLASILLTLSKSSQVKLTRMFERHGYLVSQPCS